MRGIFVGCYTLVMAVILMAAVDDKPKDPPKYEPTAAESNILIHERNMVIYAQTALQQKTQQMPEYADWQQAINDLQKHCEKISEDHKWPKGTTCNMNTLTFTPPPPAPEKPTDKKQ